MKHFYHHRNMDRILQPVHTTTSLFIKRDRTKVICTDYEKLNNLLAESLFEWNEDEKLTVDWTTVPTHPLIFEISLFERSDQSTFDTLMRFYDTVFLEVFRKYIHVPEMTMILAMGRQQTSGLRIYVVGMEVSHDDYIHLCELMNNDCIYREKNLYISLNTPSQFPFPSSNRPGDRDDLYRPVRLVHVQWNFEQLHGVWNAYRIRNVVVQQKNEYSLFGKIVNHPSRWKFMVPYMTPLPQPNATYLHFPTKIVNHLSRKKSYATLGSYLNEGDSYMILKENILVEGKPFFYDFIKKNGPHIDLVPLSFNWALYTWRNQTKIKDNPLDPIKSIDLKLKKQCPHLQDEPSPLTVVLKAHGYPVYYAMINLLKEKIDILQIQQEFPFLLSDLPIELPVETSHLSFDTILHCAYLTGDGSFISHVGAGYDWIISTINNITELKKHVLWFQKRLFPVVLYFDHLYAWDTNTEVWKKLTEPVFDVQAKLQELLEILNLNFNLPSELIKSFKENILETVVQEILQKAKNVQRQTMTQEPKVYGRNVPEYYFL